MIIYRPMVKNLVKTTWFAPQSIKGGGARTTFIEKKLRFGIVDK